MTSHVELTGQRPETYRGSAKYRQFCQLLVESECRGDFGFP